MARLMSVVSFYDQAPVSDLYLPKSHIKPLYSTYPQFDPDLIRAAAAAASAARSAYKDPQLAKVLVSTSQPLLAFSPGTEERKTLIKPPTRKFGAMVEPQKRRLSPAKPARRSKFDHFQKSNLLGVTQEEMKKITNDKLSLPKPRTHPVAYELPNHEKPSLTKEALRRSKWNWKSSPMLQFVIPEKTIMENITEASQLIPTMANAQRDIYPVTSFIDLLGMYRPPVDTVLPIYSSAKLTFLNYIIERDIWRTPASITTDFAHLLAQQRIRDNWPGGTPPKANRQSANDVLRLFASSTDFKQHLDLSISHLFPWSMRSIRSHDQWIDASNALMRDREGKGMNPLTTLRRSTPVMEEIKITLTDQDLKASFRHCGAFGRLVGKQTKNGINNCPRKSFYA